MFFVSKTHVLMFMNHLYFNEMLSFQTQMPLFQLFAHNILKCLLYKCTSILFGTETFNTINHCLILLLTFYKNVTSQNEFFASLTSNLSKTFLQLIMKVMLKVMPK